MYAYKNERDSTSESKKVAEKMAKTVESQKRFDMLNNWF